MKPSPSRKLARLASRLLISAALAGSAAHAHEGGAPQPAPGPAQELTAETLYQFLLAEIAGARGELGLSVQAYLEVAKRTRDPRIARRAAEIALYARNIEGATQAARIWLEAEPESEEARRLLAGMLASNDNRLGDIQSHLARVLADNPERIGEHLMELNRALQRISDKDAIVRIVNRLTEPYLQHPEAHFARAQAAAVAEDPLEGLAAIDGALALHPDWEPAVLLKTQLLQQANSGREALRLIDAFLGQRPDSRNARLTRARLLVAQQQFEEARSEFRTLLDGAPDDRDLNYAVALLSAQLNDLDDAERLFTAALEAGHPDASAIRLNLAQIAERRNDIDAALAHYAAIGGSEHALQARVRAAQLLARNGRLDEARAQLREPDADTETRKRLILAETQLLRDNGAPEAAFALLDEALLEHVDDHDLLYESAMVAERLDRIDVMEGRLRKLIALDPEHAHAYNALGYTLADRGLRLEEAEALILRALQLMPDDPFILDSLGWVLFRRGDNEEALEHLERAYAIRADPEIAAHLGEVLWALERHHEANAIWDDALAEHPDHRPLQDTIRRLRR